MDDDDWGFDFVAIHPRPEALDDLPSSKEITSARRNTPPRANR
jgi:hypothetical protein